MIMTKDSYTAPSPTFSLFRTLSLSFTLLSTKISAKHASVLPPVSCFPFPVSNLDGCACPEKYATKCCVTLFRVMAAAALLPLPSPLRCMLLFSPFYFMSVSNIGNNVLVNYLMCPCRSSSNNSNSYSCALTYLPNSARATKNHLFFLYQIDDMS